MALLYRFCLAISRLSGRWAHTREMCIRDSLNAVQIPAALLTIVRAAFSPAAVTGGVVGSVTIAMQKGIARGIFSNEAGLGSAPIAAAAAQTKEPVRQGLVSMTGTFIDTIVLCTITRCV